MVLEIRSISSKKDKAFQIYKNPIFELNDVNTSIGHKMNLVVKRKQKCWQDVSIGRDEDQVSGDTKHFSLAPDSPLSVLWLLSKH